MMLRCFAFLIFLVVASTGLQAGEPQVRVEILTKPPIVPGQQVQIQIDVLAPNFFMSAPKFPLFNLPNAVVTLPDTGAQNLVESIGGETYAGIRRTYVVTPQAAGDYTLPTFNITFTYAAVPGQPGSEGSVTLPAQKFTVAGAPGGAGAAAQQLTIAQDLDRDPTSLRAGDTLVRTVTVTAQGMQAMMIPVPRFTAPEGVHLYPHDPVLTDKTDQVEGSIGGTRVDRVTYAFEKTGSYRLPAIEITWYDPSLQKSEVAQAPEIAVSVQPAAGFTPAIKPPDIREDTERPTRDYFRKTLPWFAAGLAAVFILLWLLPRLWNWMRAARKERRLRYEQSEDYSFKQFAAACRIGEGRAVYAALQSWAAQIKAIPLRNWLTGDSGALAEYEQLEAALFAGTTSSGAYDAAKLLTGITEARRKWLQQQKQVSIPAALPPLNP